MRRTSALSLCLLPIALACACGGSIAPGPGKEGPPGPGNPPGSPNPAAGTDAGASADATMTPPSSGDAATSPPPPNLADGSTGPATPPGDASMTVTFPPSQLGQTGAGTTYVSGLDPTTTLDGGATEYLEEPADAGVDPAGWAATDGFLNIDSSYWGKRYQMSAQMKTKNAGAAWLWFRIDSPTASILDNMQDPLNTTISGTTGWQTVDLVLDVPQGATDFAFGSGLTGAGEVWVGPFTFAEVPDSVPETPSETLPNK